MLVIITVLILINAGIFLYFKKKDERSVKLIAERIATTLELKKTMAMGLYYRFNYPKELKKDGTMCFSKGTDLFLKQVPLDFEDFVAEIIKTRMGGDVYVTSSSGDFGVDIEHITEKGLFLGQAKAYKDDVGYEPIAILHSNMVKRNAAGGYLITTASYTKAAKEYANGLNIELIDGVVLVGLWLESMGSSVYSLSNQLI
ncbi:restriction endonuclease [Bacillus sp. S3]|uniref:restriction endonuclease n=1 Tax=Bacillus sp. S3 TaxID=486398 RepID=UPI0011884EA8|nr:restriction endonuclease [Bacillus sp. S3]QCJ41172.1 restriction endonuclease [Bacillus sp. S3]